MSKPNAGCLFVNVLLVVDFRTTTPTGLRTFGVVEPKVAPALRAQPLGYAEAILLIFGNRILAVLSGLEQSTADLGRKK